MYTVDNLQEKLEKARDNLRQVEDHLLKVDGKPSTNTVLRYQKPELRQVRNRSGPHKSDGDNEENLLEGNLFGRKVLSNVFDDSRRRANDGFGRRRHVSLSSEEPVQRKRLFPSVGQDDDTSPVRKKAFQSVVGKVQLPDLNLSLRRGREKRGREKGDDAPREIFLNPRNVFSRLSGPPDEHGELEEGEDDDDEIIMKRQPALSSRVEAIERPTPSREQVIANQKQDEARKQRDRRMFGALVGTLQQFRRDETKVKQRDERRLQIEKKLEEDAKKEKERMIEEKRELQVERKRRESDIKRIEWSLNRVKEFDAWQSSMLPLKNFGQTKNEPKLFYLPKVITSRMEKVIEETAQSVQDIIDKRLASLNEEIESSERKAKRFTGEEDDINKENEEVINEPTNQAAEMDDEGNSSEDQMEAEAAVEPKQVVSDNGGKHQSDDVEKSTGLIKTCPDDANYTIDVSVVDKVEEVSADQAPQSVPDLPVKSATAISTPSPKSTNGPDEPTSEVAPNASPTENCKNLKQPKILKSSLPPTDNKEDSNPDAKTKATSASPKSRQNKTDSRKSRSPSRSRSPSKGRKRSRSLSKRRRSRSRSVRKRSRSPRRRSRSPRKRSRSPRRSRSQSKSRRRSPKRSPPRRRRPSPKRRPSPRRRSPTDKARPSRREEPKKRSGNRSSTSRSRSKSSASSSSSSNSN